MENLTPEAIAEYLERAQDGAEDAEPNVHAELESAATMARTLATDKPSAESYTADQARALAARITRDAAAEREEQLENSLVERAKSVWFGLLGRMGLLDPSGAIPRRGTPRGVGWSRWGLALGLCAIIGALVVTWEPKVEPEQTSPVVSDGMRLTTENESRMVALSNDAQVALGRHTDLKILDDHLLRLDQGDAWFNVRKGGRGLAIETERATVRVTGTQFGVKTTPRLMVVSVIEGSVQVLGDHTTLVARAGEELKFSTLDEASVRSLGNQPLPEWLVSTLRENPEFFPVAEESLLGRYEFESDVRTIHSGTLGNLRNLVVPDPIEPIQPVKWVEGETDANGYRRRGVLRLPGGDYQSLGAVATRAVRDVEQYTVSLWAKSDQVNQGACVVSMGSNLRFPQIQNASTGRVYELMQHDDTARPNINTPFGEHRPNVWQHLVFTWDGETARVYIDGVQTGESRPPANSMGFACLRFGRSRVNRPCFSGFIDDARVFDRVLNPNEIELLALR